MQFCKRYVFRWETLVFIGSFLIFGAIVHYGMKSDLDAHYGYITPIVEGRHPVPAAFLYYLVVYIFALFQTKAIFLQVSTVFVLSSSMVAKYLVTKHVLTGYLDKAMPGNDAKSMIALFSLALLIVFSLPTNTISLGQIPPNIWHNSTTIFLMPFALLLFWVSYRNLLEPTMRGYVMITVLSVLNVLIKPSFFIVYLAVYPLLLLKLYGFKREFWLGLVPIILVSVLLLAVYYFTYESSYDGTKQGDAGVVIKPFWVWSKYSSNIAVSLVASLVFPITYMVIYFRDLLRSLFLQYALTGFVVAIVIAALFTETGTREFHGNFFWQSIVCNYILFLACVAMFIEKLSKAGFANWKNVVVLIAFILHVGSGINFLFHYMDTGRFF